MRSCLRKRGEKEKKEKKRERGTKDEEDRRRRNGKGVAPLLNTALIFYALQIN